MPFITKEKEDYKTLICEISRHLYTLGWVSGTGGGISIKDNEHVLIAPSGVEKEKINSSDIFTTDICGKIIEAPQNPMLKLSACTPLFLEIYKKRQAGAIIHSHSINAFLASKVAYKLFNCNSVDCVKLKNHLSECNNSAIAEIILKEIEMLKGIKGQGYFDTHYVPVIKNTAQEEDLAEALAAALDAYPEAYAVVVENHGVYVWGDSVTQAKTHAECYDYLFNAYVKLFELGLMENQ